VRAAETAAILSNYIRLLGYEARGHSQSCSDVDLNKLAVAAGLAQVEQGAHGPILTNPYTGARLALCAVTTTLGIAPDRPLATAGLMKRGHSHGPAWQLGMGFAKNRFNQQAYRKRRYVDGAYPFEKSRRVDTPTTLIDEPRIPRVPKRTDMLARAIFGDMREKVQDGARNGNYVRKSATSFAARRPLGAFVLLQDGPVTKRPAAGTDDATRNAHNIKAALYFLGADAVGISRCPEWAYYSHDAGGEPRAA